MTGRGQSMLSLFQEQKSSELNLEVLLLTVWREFIWPGKMDRTNNFSVKKKTAQKEKVCSLFPSRLVQGVMWLLLRRCSLELWIRWPSTTPWTWLSSLLWVSQVRRKKKSEAAPPSLLWRRPSQNSYSGLVRHQKELTYGSRKSGEADNKTCRSSTAEAINVWWLCQRRSDVFTAFAVLFRRAKRDKLSWNINNRSSPSHLFKDRFPVFKKEPT